MTKLQQLIQDLLSFLKRTLGSPSRYTTTKGEALSSRLRNDYTMAGCVIRTKENLNDASFFIVIRLDWEYDLVEIQDMITGTKITQPITDMDEYVFVSYRGVGIKMSKESLH